MAIEDISSSLAKLVTNQANKDTEKSGKSDSDVTNSVLHTLTNKELENISTLVTTHPGHISINGDTVTITIEHADKIDNTPLDMCIEIPKKEVLNILAKLYVQ